MRLLLVSDTHGHLDGLASLAEQTRAEAVVHAGDLGFYDQESVDRLEPRELFLRVVHSTLGPAAKKQAQKLKGAGLRDYIRKNLPLSDLIGWFRTKRGFPLPTFAVWGNHEDGAVVADLVSGRRSVPNLTLLGTATLGPFCFFGLGGNLIPTALGQEMPLEEGRGKVRASASDVSALLDSIPPRGANEIRVLVTHVSPGKVPLVGLLAQALNVDLTVSGHMGSPYGCVWDEFAVRESEEAETRQEQALRELPEPLRERLAKRLGHGPSRAYRGRFHINLPDADDGYGVLELRGGRVRLETVSAGFPVGR